MKSSENQKTKQRNLEGSTSYKLAIPETAERIFTKQNRSLSPTESIKLPQLQKPRSSEKQQLEDPLTLAAKEIMRIHTQTQQQKPHSFNETAVPPKTSYPNLKIMQSLLNDGTQKKSLQLIMQKNPILAASLNLYASSHQQILKHKKFRNKVNQVNQYIQKIESSQHAHILQPTTGSNLQRVTEEKEPKQTIKQVATIKKKKTKFRKTSPIVRLNGNKHQRPQGKYNFYLGVGNNEDIIRRVLLGRGYYWNEVKQNDATINLRWCQSYFGYNFEKLCFEQKKELYNHFEFHKEITTKTGLLKNLKKQSQINKVDVFSITPTVFMLNLEEKTYQDELNQFISYFIQNLPQKFKTDRASKTQLNLDLTQGNVLGYISPYKFNYEATQSYNQTNPNLYETPSKLDDVFLSDVNYLWLLKPADMNRGNGVHVFSDLGELEILLQSYYDGWYQKDYEQPPGLVKKADQNQSENQNKQILEIKEDSMNQGKNQTNNQELVSLEQKQLEQPQVANEENVQQTFQKIEQVYIPQNEEKQEVAEQVGIPQGEEKHYETEQVDIPLQTERQEEIKSKEIEYNFIQEGLVNLNQVSEKNQAETKNVSI